MFFFFFMLKFLFFIMIELFYIVVFVQSIGVPNWNMQRCGKDCIVLSTPLSFFGSNASFSRSVWQISRKSFHTSDILMPLLPAGLLHLWGGSVRLADTSLCVSVPCCCDGTFRRMDWCWRPCYPSGRRGRGPPLAVGGIVASISPSAGI